MKRRKKKMMKKRKKMKTMLRSVCQAKKQGYYSGFSTENLSYSPQGQGHVETAPSKGQLMLMNAYRKIQTGAASRMRLGQVETTDHQHPAEEHWQSTEAISVQSSALTKPPSAPRSQKGNSVKLVKSVQSAGSKDSQRVSTPSLSTRPRKRSIQFKDDPEEIPPPSQRFSRPATGPGGIAPPQSPLRVGPASAAGTGGDAAAAAAAAPAHWKAALPANVKASRHKYVDVSDTRPASPGASYHGESPAPSQGVVYAHQVAPHPPLPPKDQGAGHMEVRYLPEYDVVPPQHYYHSKAPSPHGTRQSLYVEVADSETEGCEFIDATQGTIIYFMLTAWSSMVGVYVLWCHLVSRRTATWVFVAQPHFVDGLIIAFNTTVCDHGKLEGASTVWWDVTSLVLLWNPEMCNTSTG